LLNTSCSNTINHAHVSSSEHVSTSEHVSILEPVVPEHIVPEQVAPEQTQSSTIPIPKTAFKQTCIDNCVTIATSTDTDSDDDQDNPQSSNMDIDIVSDQPSSSIPQTTNGQSSSNLAIVPVASPKPTKIPSPPTIFLDSTLLQNVCENIGQELVQLIQARENLVYKENYEKRWSRLKERVDYVLFALQSTCIDTQAQAQQKLQDWLKGIDDSL
jgi:hypothetical protein